MIGGKVLIFSHLPPILLIVNYLPSIFHSCLRRRKTCDGHTERGA